MTKENIRYCKYCSSKLQSESQKKCQVCGTWLGFHRTVVILSVFFATSLSVVSLLLIALKPFDFKTEYTVSNMPNRSGEFSLIAFNSGSIPSSVVNVDLVFNSSTNKVAWQTDNHSVKSFIGRMRLSNEEAVVSSGEVKVLDLSIGSIDEKDFGVEKYKRLSTFWLYEDEYSASNGVINMCILTRQDYVRLRTSISRCHLEVTEIASRNIFENLKHERVDVDLAINFCRRYLGNYEKRGLPLQNIQKTILPLLTKEEC